MQLSSKHQQQTIVRADFSGGLNTTSIPEMIADNQLAECTNMEFNKATGALQTACGTATIAIMGTGTNITALFYDKINNLFWLVDDSNNVFSTRLLDLSGTTMDMTKVGTINGTSRPMATMWENGLIIASGGKLQYCYVEQEEDTTTGGKLDVPTMNTITNSPDVCNGVFVKSGRVWTWYDYRLHCSSVGDETDWTTDDNVASSSQWIDIGYKEGEYNNSSIVGVAPLSSDVIVIKADGKVYRLTGEVGDWTLIEVARNIDIMNSRSYCAINDGVMILGRNSLFYLQATQTYGDVHPENMAVNISKLMLDLSTEKTQMVYLASQNEVWITGTEGTVVVYDVTFKAFLRRKFNSEVVDIVDDYHETPLIVRADKVTALSEGLYLDEAFSMQSEPLEWAFTCKSGTVLNNLLVKRVDIKYVPLETTFDTCYVALADKRIKVNLQADAPMADDWDDPIFQGDDVKIFPVHTMIKGGRAVWRTRVADIQMYGYSAPIMLESITITYAEV